MKNHLPDYLALAVVAVLLALAPLTFGGSDYYLRLATQALIYMAYGVAFNIIFGHTRQLFLCVGALAGCSAYVAVLLITKAAFSPWLSIPLGIATAAIIGAIFTYISVRRGLGVIFVGVVTLVFSMIFHNVILGTRRLTNGETGIETKDLLPLLQPGLTSYYWILGFLLIALLLYYLLMRSRAGTAFSALADDELAAELAGIDVTRYKVLAAAVGSALVGAAGAIYAFYGGFINPTVYGLVNVDIVVLVTLLLGGMGTMLGPVIGGVIFTALDEIVRPMGRLNVLVYGVLMIVLVITFRRGLVTALRRLTGARIP